MKSSVFDFDDFRLYLQHFLRHSPSRGHGLRTRIAEAAQCRSAYVSQVLSGSAAFSPEQADGISRFLGHAEDEADFFLLLTQLDRAGTTALRERLARRVREIRQARLVLKNRVDIKHTVSAEHQARYYGTWLHAAVHILLTIPGMRTVDALARHFSLPRRQVQESVSFLMECGLVARDGAQLRVTDSRIFLPGDSPLIKQHHTNWRLKTISALDADPQAGVHLSTVFSLSADDAQALREKMLDFIERTRKTARASKEEELHCFCLDYYPVR